LPSIKYNYDPIRTLKKQIALHRIHAEKHGSNSNRSVKRSIKNSGVFNVPDVRKKKRKRREREEEEEEGEGLPHLYVLCIGLTP